MNICSLVKKKRKKGKFSLKNLSFPSEAPCGMFEVHLVSCCPSSKDGLLSDEAMTPTLRVLVDPVHPALIDPIPLVVMVRNNTVIGSTAVAVIDHPVNVDAVTHIDS